MSGSAIGGGHAAYVADGARRLSGRALADDGIGNAEYGGIALDAFPVIESAASVRRRNQP